MDEYVRPAPEEENDLWLTYARRSVPPENGALLLQEVRDTIERYVVFPSREASTAVALWTVATHAVHCFEHATRLAVHSPEKQCGKSRLLEVIDALVYQPVRTTNASVSSLFRVIERADDRPPTVILDEADRLFGRGSFGSGKSELIALVNNGFRDGAPTLRVIGGVPTQFSNFAMVALAGIGRFPDTVEDRAVNITMRRRLPEERVQEFRARAALPTLQRLRERIACWVDEFVVPNASHAVANMPTELSDRAADCWEPLLTIADIAGAQWSRRSREAAVALSHEAEDEAHDALGLAGVRLLASVKEVFDQCETDFLPSQELVVRLMHLESAAGAGTGLSMHKLASGLRPYAVKPRQDATHMSRGYHREDFDDAFARYLHATVHVSDERSEANARGLQDDSDSRIVLGGGSYPQTDGRTLDVRNRATIKPLSDDEFERSITAQMQSPFSMPSRDKHPASNAPSTFERFATGKAAWDGMPEDVSHHE